MRGDHPTFQVKDFMLPYCPESTRVVAMNAHDVIDRPAVNRQRPRNKSNPVKPVHALGTGGAISNAQTRQQPNAAMAVRRELKRNRRSRGAAILPSFRKRSDGVLPFAGAYLP